MVTRRLNHVSVGGYDHHFKVLGLLLNNEFIRCKTRLSELPCTGHETAYSRKGLFNIKMEFCSKNGEIGLNFPLFALFGAVYI